MGLVHFGTCLGPCSTLGVVEGVLRICESKSSKSLEVGAAEEGAVAGVAKGLKKFGTLWNGDCKEDLISSANLCWKQIRKLEGRIVSYATPPPVPYLFVLVCA